VALEAEVGRAELPAMEEVEMDREAAAAEGGGSGARARVACDSGDYGGDDHVVRGCATQRDVSFHQAPLPF
jgi:hypothetical protein